MSEFLSKEEIKKWRSSVEKITLEEYAARLGKKIQEEKKTNDLADMLYTRYNPMQSVESYDSITKLEKIDLTPKATVKSKSHSSKNNDDIFDVEVNEDDLLLDDNEDIFDDSDDEIIVEKVKKETAKSKKVETKEVTIAAKEEKMVKETAKKASAKEKPIKTQKTVAEAKKETAKAKVAEKALKEDVKRDFSELNITFNKVLTDREERVLSYFMEKRGEIVYAKDLAELLDLKRDYIYKYIKNLRAKMSTDLIVNADNGGFILN